MNGVAASWAPLLVFMGAGCGALLRWSFGVWWNAAAPGWPWGTLAANLLGGLGVGLVLSALDQGLQAGWSQDTVRAVRLLAVTGFLGGLTTFSTFSAEVVEFMGQGRWRDAALWAALHLLASLALTALGLGLAAWAAPWVAGRG